MHMTSLILFNFRHHSVTVLHFKYALKSFVLWLCGLLCKFLIKIIAFAFRARDA